MKRKIAEEIAALALRSILYEISCSPKPGLVDRLNSGSHADMDFYSFINSSSVLTFYFYEIVKKSLELKTDLKGLFPEIRKIGIKAEKEMLAATNGVNTQKGLIFSMGILCSSIGHMIRTRKGITPSTISLAISEMTAGLVSTELHHLKPDGKGKPNLTKGEKAYLRYGAAGIGGEAETGFPSVINHGLPAFRQASLKSTDLDIRMVHTLITIMSVAEDTLVLSKGGFPLLHFVQNQAALILARGSVFNKRGLRRVKDLDALFIRKDISPGGSADLLAVTLMFILIVEYAKSRTL